MFLNGYVTLRHSPSKNYFKFLHLLMVISIVTFIKGYVALNLVEFGYDACYG
jgi:hypothetical protein